MSENKKMKRIISKLDWDRLNDTTVNEVKLRFFSEGEIHHYFGDRPNDHIVEVTFKKCEAPEAANEKGEKAMSERVGEQ